jgi:hypothetical protein
MTRHVQLNTTDHGKLRVRMERSADLGDGAMFAPVFPGEFRRAQAHYPIVFIKDAGTGGFRPVALFGLEEGSNLFLDDGRWDAPYLPRAVRMQPFLIGRVASANGEQRLEVHIDLDHPRVSESLGEPIFLDHGGHAPVLQEATRLLSEVHEGEQLLPGFCASLQELDLIEPFTLDITLDDGTQGRLAGYYTIAEETLHGLDGAALERLQTAGFLNPVFMMIASMAQLTGLIERRNAHCGPSA